MADKPKPPIPSAGTPLYSWADAWLFALLIVVWPMIIGLLTYAAVWILTHG